MSERVITIEMACASAGTHDPHNMQFNYVCPSCNSGMSAPTNAWACEDCEEVVERHRGQSDVSCLCGALYNSGGQRLRDDYMNNPSMYNDDISDLDGYEMMYAGDY